MLLQHRFAGTLQKSSLAAVSENLPSRAGSSRIKSFLDPKQEICLPNSVPRFVPSVHQPSPAVPLLE